MSNIVRKHKLEAVTICMPYFCYFGSFSIKTIVYTFPSIAYSKVYHETPSICLSVDSDIFYTEI